MNRLPSSRIPVPDLSLQPLGSGDGSEDGSPGSADRASVLRRLLGFTQRARRNLHVLLLDSTVVVHEEPSPDGPVRMPRAVLSFRDHRRDRRSSESMAVHTASGEPG